MAYTHNTYEVIMQLRHSIVTAASPGQAGNYGVMPTTVTGLTPSIGGIALWGPGIVPHKVHAVAVLPMNTLATQLAAVSSQARFKFSLCATHGAVTVFTASDVFNTLSVPTTVTGGAMHQSKALVNYVTSTVVVRPGQYIKLTTDDSNTGSFFGVLMVSPAWEMQGNVTSQFLAPGAS